MCASCSIDSEDLLFLFEEMFVRVCSKVSNSILFLVGLVIGLRFSCHNNDARGMLYWIHLDGCFLVALSSSRARRYSFSRCVRTASRME